LFDRQTRKGLAQITGAARKTPAPLPSQPGVQKTVTQRWPSVESLKTIKLAAVFFGLLFAGLLAFRMGVFQPAAAPPHTNLSPQTIPDRDTWMAVFQDNRQIGYSHSQLKKTGSAFSLREEVDLRINTMGVEQDIKLLTTADLHPDFSLDAFTFTISSGRFQVAAEGKVTGKTLTVQTQTAGAVRKTVIPLKTKPFLGAGLLPSIGNRQLKPGDTYEYNLFDPSAMGPQQVRIHVLGKETIDQGGTPISATKLTIDYQGAIQTAWLDDRGDVLREEGLLGLRLERGSRRDVLEGTTFQASQDLTRIASVPSNRILDAPAELTRLTVALAGVELNRKGLHGGRQVLDGHRLVVKKESLPDQPLKLADLRNPTTVAHLAATPFVQSDHPEILAVVKTTVSPEDAPAVSVHKLMDWMARHIEKRPVLSMPDALSTLKNRMGDCNEHAVLLAALARATGIPARIEAGLVYLNGRFYYHAWNRLYLGEWITADALFGQFPADVTHLRFAVGVENLQAGLISLIDRIKIDIVEAN
jgi:hypothetical protein